MPCSAIPPDNLQHFLILAHLLPTFPPTQLSRPAPPPFRRICLTQPGAALPEGAITQRLSSFLHWAGPAVIGALGAAGRAGPDVPRPAQPLSGPLSAGFTPLAYPELLAGRPVVALQYAPSAVPLLLVAYGSPHSSWERRLKDHSLAGRGLCAVWDASAPARPQTLLASEGLPACVAWLPSRSAHVVFAGARIHGLKLLCRSGILGRQRCCVVATGYSRLTTFI